MAATNEDSPTHNPYAPSSASLDAVDARRGLDGEIAVWRDAKTLVMLPGAVLPDRCVKCNAPADAPTKNRKVYWHHWGIYLVVLINIIFYAIVALIVRKKAVVAPGLCARHKTRRAVALAIGWTGVLGGLALLFVGIAQTIDPAFALLGLLLMLFAAIELIAFGRIVYPTRIDSDYVRLKGCKPAFLDTLPPFPG